MGIKCLDEFGNIDDASIHNAEMISAYLHNFAIDYESELSDAQYGLLVRCGDLLWILSRSVLDEE